MQKESSGTKFLNTIDTNARNVLERFEKKYGVKAVWTISTDEVFCDGIFFVGPIEPILRDFGIGLNELKYEDVGDERKVIFKLGEVMASGYLGSLELGVKGIGL